MCGKIIYRFSVQQGRGKIEGKSSLSLVTPLWPDVKGMYLVLGLVWKHIRSSAC